MRLSTKQIAFLRGLGQALRPQLHVGHEGYREEVHLEPLLGLFKRRELVKVRLLNTTEDEPDDVAARMAGASDSVLVGVVGKTFVLYRPNPDVREPIVLPERGPARRSEARRPGPAPQRHAGRSGRARGAGSRASGTRGG